jgi:hypothetical protein
MNSNIETIINSYKLLDDFIENIYNDIKNINELHINLLNTFDKKDLFNQYGTYIDDIYFQKNYILKEVKHIENLKSYILRKLYGDLFHLYQKIIRRFVNINCETNNISIIKKYYTEHNIYIYNELDIIIIYKIKDIQNISNHINNYINLMKDIQKDMSNNLKIMNSNVENGYNMGSFIIVYTSEMYKLKEDLNVYDKIYENGIRMNYNILNKLITRAKCIANEVSDDKLEFDTKTKKKDFTNSYSFDNTPIIKTPNIIDINNIDNNLEDNNEDVNELKLQIDRNI